ncbi:hypothetical protein AB0C33_02010 [Nonomuraea sp. NPDC048881]|uniref:hypothetical protein n=1 Tax=Nonomuraea sp. NPDC048881 TaxID=3155030 RepID=UPI0034099CF0
MSHWHVGVSANGRLIPERQKCFHGPEAEWERLLEEAKGWVADEIGSDSQMAERTAENNEERDNSKDDYARLSESIAEYEGQEDGWYAVTTADGIEWGYRLLAVEGDCDETV